VANGVPEDKVFARGEQTSWAGAGQPAGAALEDQIALRHVESDDSLNDTGIPNPGWLIFRDGIDRTGWPTNRDVNHESEPIRAQYRRADIYAVEATPSNITPVEPQDDQTLDPALRRVLIPGTQPAPKPGDSPLPDQTFPYR